MEIVKYYYDDITSVISSYGGEICGDQDQSLRKSMKIILNSPHLDNKIKKTKDYKEYHSMFFNKEEEEEDEKYSEYEKGRKEIYDYTDDILSDGEEDNNYYSENSNGKNSNGENSDGENSDG